MTTLNYIHDKVKRTAVKTLSTFTGSTIAEELIRNDEVLIDIMLDLTERLEYLRLYDVASVSLGKDASFEAIEAEIDRIQREG